MANFPKMTLTNAGILALTKVQSGKTLAFKRIALGEGQLNGAPISPLTALISQKATVDVSSGKILGENTYQVGALFKNMSIAAGFWWREVGAIIYDPDDSTKEVLLCYSNAGDAGDYIPPSTDQRIEKYVYVSMGIANAGSVTITIPASDSYLLASEKGAAGGVAVLDEDGKLPSNQIPTGGISPANHASSHATGGSDPLTAAQIGAATTKTLTCTVPVSWSSSGGYYYQQISVPGMLATDNPVADILPGSDNAANKLYAESWGKVQSIDTLNGAIKIWCTSVPTTAFPVQFKVVR